MLGFWFSFGFFTGFVFEVSFFFDWFVWFLVVFFFLGGGEVYLVVVVFGVFGWVFVWLVALGFIF